MSHISEPKVSSHNPPETLKTASLYKLAIGRGMSSSSVERAAQQLYEGISLGGEVTSLITYPRTDRTELSEDFVEDLRKYISFKYSSKYLQPEGKENKKNVLKKKDSLVQGAHEGIRPVDLSLSPEKISAYIATSSPEYKLYNIIWAYTVSAFSVPSKTQSTKYIFNNQENLFSLNVTKEVFDGYKHIMREYGLLEKAELPSKVLEKVKVGDCFKQKNAKIEERQTDPPAKYNEASLISALEKKGIGRPSTYPTISRTVLSRNYVTMQDKKLEITKLGYIVSKDLEKNFSNFISYDYTRLMEEELDNISKSKTDWKKFLMGVFEMWDDSYSKAEKFELVEGRNCPQCNHSLAFKFSRTGSKFIGCIRFPECKYSEKFFNEQEGEEKLDRNCPQCNFSLAKKKNRWGNFFVSCTNYPKCKYIETIKAEFELVEDDFCPGCSAQLVYKFSAKRKTKFKACPNYPSCNYRNESKQAATPPVILDRNCPRCSKPMAEKLSRYGKKFVACSGFPKCKYIEGANRARTRTTRISRERPKDKN